MSRSPVVSLDSLELDTLAHCETLEARMGRIGPVIGMEQLGATLTIVPRGKRAFPYHRHHIIEEAILILQGEADYRYGDEVYPARAGDVIAAPAGAEAQAHQLINTGQEELRYVCFSTMQKTDVVEYPDSNKVGAITWSDESGEGDGVLFRHRAYAQEVDYWEGEE
jgi:uncharacterized cupin superfamily protein